MATPAPEGRGGGIAESESPRLATGRLAAHALLRRLLCCRCRAAKLLGAGKARTEPGVLRNTKRVTLDSRNRALSITTVGKKRLRVRWSAFGPGSYVHSKFLEFLALPDSSGQGGVDWINVWPAHRADPVWSCAAALFRREMIAVTLTWAAP